ncbi:ATP-binding protein [Streptomyces sp. NPDC046712]|uniref:ATP-binding protein n=1 Tax=Streptomyces sp. NPDC046712 TaxID=3154802 RepID=UPI0033E94E12
MTTITPLPRRSTPVETSHTLPPIPASVREARLIVARELAVNGFAAHSDDAELLASELVTNAVSYAGGEIVLVLSFRDDTVHCEVRDSSPVAPVQRRSPDDDEHGRGLFLVQTLARSWGTRVQGTGKAVWFELGPASWCEQPGSLAA